MSNKPKIYATCPAGCLWETVHKDDFLRSAAYIKQTEKAEGYILEQGRTYRLKKRFEGATTWGFAFAIVYKYWATADSPPMEFEETVEITLPAPTEFDDYAKIKICGYKWNKVLILVYEYNGTKYEESLAAFSYLDDYGITVYGLVQDAGGCWLVNEDAEAVARDGVGIASIEKTATEGLVDTYTVTMEDGSTETFTVTNGEKGEQGEKGATGGLDNIVHTPGDGEDVVMSQKAVTDRFADISADEKVVIDSTAPFTDGHYILNDGTITDGGGSWFITDFIAVEPYKVIGFTLMGFNNWGDIVLDTITFYDKDKNRIGGFSPKSKYNGAWSTQLVIPDGCEFIKCMHNINDAFTPYVCLAKETISVPLDDSTLMENQDVFKFDGSIWQSVCGRFYKTAQIRCEGFTSVSFHLSAFHSASDGIGLQSVTFLGENGNYINGANCAIHDLCVKDVIQTVPIPEGAKWMYGFHMPEIDYEPYIKLNYIENGVTNIVCIGDSLTEGYTADNVILKENYPNKLQEKLGKGYTVLNQGVGGSFANTWWSNHKQYLRINDREVDIILIMLGGNYGLDDTFETAVDPYDDYNDYGDTVSGNTCKLIEWLQEQAPSAQIVMLTPTFADATKVPNNAQYMDNQCKYMPKITERYHLPVIDVRNLHGINKRNCNNFLASDGLHGTAEFYSRLGTIVANQLRSIQSV